MHSLRKRSLPDPIRRTLKERSKTKQAVVLGSCGYSPDGSDATSFMLYSYVQKTCHVGRYHIRPRLNVFVGGLPKIGIPLPHPAGLHHYPPRTHNKAQRGHVQNCPSHQVQRMGERDPPVHTTCDIYTNIVKARASCYAACACLPSGRVTP